MAEETGGAEIWLDQVPLKYPGLSPWEIWISEAQERMSLAVQPENVQVVVDHFASRGVEDVARGVRHVVELLTTVRVDAEPDVTDFGINLREGQVNLLVVPLRIALSLVAAVAYGAVLRC